MEESSFYDMIGLVSISMSRILSRPKSIIAAPAALMRTYGGGRMPPRLINRKTKKASKLFYGPVEPIDEAPKPIEAPLPLLVGSASPYRCRCSDPNGSERLLSRGCEPLPL